jgi:hypothetical protein
LFLFFQGGLPPHGECGAALGKCNINNLSALSVEKPYRGTVLRIQALAMVAIVLSFILVVYGSCRRWSNRWIIQKGFLAAQVVSLSLGTYSIGLMQSSSVKSEMYPVWAVALLTLFAYAWIQSHPTTALATRARF